MQPIAERTRSSIAQRPHLLEALADDVLNVSAAARKLEVDEARHQAVASAIRRLRDDLDEGAVSASPRVRIDRDPTPDSLPPHLDLRDGMVQLEVAGGDLSHHRAVVGRLGALGIELYATMMVDGYATYVIDSDDLGDALPAIERSACEAIYRSIHSSATRVNGR